MSKKCCNVHFRVFSVSGDYTELETLIMNLISISTTKNPKNPTKKILKKQAKMLYDCCNTPSKLEHSFGELDEHAKYSNRYNIEEAKQIWTKNKKEKKKK